ncbi:TPA: hypothetical protein ACR3Z0_005485 [Bacillus thuringiensis]|uniref:Uncharacterized protein n=1 Tax=Bacillus thuringiensis TaxID=1428 RepID=A0A9X6KTC6_BACTU|nr:MULTISPECIES: hypothetical protein [Bacillus cereus group]AJA23338.1 hypothetical protein BT4G5_31475 [Bacillus thuringiensis serovar galleriae]ETE91780.1 hypothetical protein C621_0217175 [Bacillus thuringiensis serovar aizawai str. Leapi01]ETE97280.1 hypothetical protein C623_0215165 [Bacillus thuringiensis serovar aizawai str. Hu4-2]KAB1371147.1 hypothetical protein FPG93_30960 [Bacillus thuringiensis]KLA36215.1 hypothetical protein B4158_5811 [Bacillus cereus]
MGYFNVELMKAEITQEEAIYIVTNYIQRIADNKADKLYAAEVIERVHNEDSSTKDIDFIIRCRKML